MSIESEMKKLTIVLTEVSSALQSLNIKPQTHIEKVVTETKELKNVAEVKESVVEKITDDLDDLDDLKPEITYKSVKILAREKMSKGLDKKEIKKFIEKRDCDSFSDLDQEGIEKLYSFLESQ